VSNPKSSATFNAQTKISLNVDVRQNAVVTSHLLLVGTCVVGQRTAMRMIENSLHVQQAAEPTSSTVADETVMP
jgi:hypothetical protein